MLLLLYFNSKVWKVLPHPSKYPAQETNISFRGYLLLNTFDWGKKYAF